MVAGGESVRSIAARLDRVASTVSREAGRDSSSREYPGRSPQALRRKGRGWNRCVTRTRRH